MAQVSGRKANSSVGAAIVLMLCIAVFAATLFYLMTSPGMSLAFEDGANEVNYDNFRTLAMRRRIVYLIADEDAEALLLRLEDSYYVWTPQES